MRGSEVRILSAEPVFTPFTGGKLTKQIHRGLSVPDLHIQGIHSPFRVRLIDQRPQLIAMGKVCALRHNLCSFRVAATSAHQSTNNLALLSNVSLPRDYVALHFRATGTSASCH